MSAEDTRHTETYNVYHILMELKNEIGVINGRLEQIDKRLSSVEERLNRIERSIYRNSNRVHIKYMLIMLGLILGFVAAMFGLGWRPLIP